MNAKKLVKNYPYSADAHYEYGIELEKEKQWYRAFEEYNIAHILVEKGYPFKFDIERLFSKIEMLGNLFIQHAGDESEEFSKRGLEYITNQNKYDWNISNPFHATVSIIGDTYYDYLNLGRLYVARRGATENWKLRMEKNSGITVEDRAELQRASDWCTDFSFESDMDVYLPILTNEYSMLWIENNGKKYEVFHREEGQFINYRIPAGRNRIRSEFPMRIGEVVPILHVDGRKRLVLNIFVDGLTQKVLDNDLESYMPYTKKFFSKGVICNNVYTAAEWTYPSITSIHTGHSASRHKMLHPDVLRKIDEETPMLAEYFKAAGYNTSKFGGNWRITPNYGYARGMNRTIYQNHYFGYWADQVITDVEEQIYRMKDTDQFIWMELIELHTVADDVGLGADAIDVSLDKNKVPEAWKNTSVKQEYDETQQAFYLEELKKVDRRLASLYHFIEDNYEDNEILVTLFSDHGQGFLIEPGKDFFADERSRVPFMIRGTGQCGVSNELMSVCDYPAILCKEAGIAFEYTNTDANLPKTFGGAEERDFAVTESIHPGDKYQMRITGNAFDFYLHSEKPVSDDCRVDLSGFVAVLVDKNNEIIDNEEFKETCIEFCINHLGTCLTEE